jgi:O-antigen/teichoic acid export membrane protein
LKSYDTDTSEGRSKERLRRVSLTAVGSAFSQGTKMLTMLISVPLTLNYLGAERYGLWVTISSSIAILGFVDLGMGNGLLNAIADAHGNNDRKAAESFVSSAFFILSGLAILFGVIWVIINPYISWIWLFNVITPKAMVEAGPAVSVFVWCLIINLPIGLVQKIYDGYQEGYINGLWQAAGSILGLLSVLIAIYVQADLPWLVLAMAGSPVLVMVFSTVRLFGFRRAWLKPNWSMVNRVASSRILKDGSLFFVLQLAAAVGFQTDSLVIARFLGASQVPQYAIPMRLFLIITSLLNMVLAPLWPAYGEALARKDVTWVIKTFKRSILISFGISVFLSLFLVVFGSKIIELWVGPEIQPSFILLLGFGLWTVVSSIAGPIAMLLNGANVIAFQVIFAILMAVGNLSVSIFLVQRIGVSGPIFGSVISSLLFSVLPLTFLLPSLFSKWKLSESRP